MYAIHHFHNFARYQIVEDRTAPTFARGPQCGRDRGRVVDLYAHDDRGRPVYMIGVRWSGGTVSWHNPNSLLILGTVR